MTLLRKLYEKELKNESVWDKFKIGLKKLSDREELSSQVRAQCELCDIMNAWPAVSWHSQEYVRYFQGKGGFPSRDYVVKAWDLNERVRWMKRVWRDIAECNSGKKSAREVYPDRNSDMIAQVIDSVEGDLNMMFPVNVRNNGRISNLPEDCIVELFGKFGKKGVDVAPFGDIPRGILGMTQQIIDQQELALEAAVTGKYDLLVRAIACDPLVMSLNDAKDIAYDLMAVEEEDLPEKWAGYWKM